MAAMAAAAAVSDMQAENGMQRWDASRAPRRALFFFCATNRLRKPEKQLLRITHGVWEVLLGTRAAPHPAVLHTPLGGDQQGEDWGRLGGGDSWGAPPLVFWAGLLNNDESIGFLSPLFSSAPPPFFFFFFIFTFSSSL